MERAVIATTVVDRATRRQVGWFVVAGVCATSADALVYFALVRAGVLGHDGSKFLSFLVGTVVAYLINKFRTFRSPRRSAMEALRFVLLYGTALGVNVGVNHGVLALCRLAWLPHAPPGGPFPAWATAPAFLAATACSTVLNFFGQKTWVFRARSA